MHLKLQLPYPLPAAEARYADTSSVQQLIRLAPGEPAALHSEDCALVQQLRELLLGALPVRVSAADFHCAAPRDSFAITLSAAVAPAQAGGAG